MPFTPALDVRCVAHRGNSKICPENTRASFFSAIETGADAIELDIQMSSDNQVFVFHDIDFKRMNIPSLPNYETQFAEIADRDIGSWFDRKYSEERVVSIEELFSLFARKIHLLIEVKTWLPFSETEKHYKTMLKKVLDNADEMNIWPRFELLCYEKEVLFMAKSLDSRFRCVLNTDYPINREALRHLKEEGVNAISVYIENLSEAFVDEIQSEKLPLYTFTCNNNKQLVKARKAGSNVIMTDDPAWLIQQIYGGQNETQ